MDSEAVRAANDGISLRANTESPVVQATGLNYLGVASFWAKDFGTASGTLEASICFVNEESDDAAACFHPLVNLCFCEVLRIIDGESKRRSPADISMLEKLISQARTLEKRGQTGTLNQGTSDIGFLLLDFSSCFASIRSDRLEDADIYYLACLNRASRLPRNSWLQAIVLWARLEHAKGYGDIEKAIVSAQAMGEFGSTANEDAMRVVSSHFAKELPIKARNLFATFLALVVFAFTAVAQPNPRCDPSEMIQIDEGTVVCVSGLNATAPSPANVAVAEAELAAKKAAAQAYLEKDVIKITFHIKDYGGIAVTGGVELYPKEGRTKFRRSGSWCEIAYLETTFSITLWGNLLVSMESPRYPGCNRIYAEVDPISKKITVYVAPYEGGLKQRAGARWVLDN
jgi:hypothetical protein